MPLSPVVWLQWPRLSQPSWPWQTVQLQGWSVAGKNIINIFSRILNLEFRFEPISVYEHSAAHAWANVYSNACIKYLSFAEIIGRNWPIGFPVIAKLKEQTKEAQWPIGYGVRLRIKRSSVRIRPWPLRWVLGQGSLLPLSQGEAFTLAFISYLAILVKYILAKKKKEAPKILSRP